MMSRAPRAILAAIATAALTAAASACQGSPQPAAATPTATAQPAINYLKGLSSYQIIGKAFANTEAAPNVQVTGKVTRSSQSTRLSPLSLVNGAGGGCIGDIYKSAVGSFQLISDGTSAWILPSPDFWQIVDASNPSVPPTIEGKYLAVKPGGKGLGALVSLCSLTTLVGTGPSPARRTGFGNATPTIVAGVPAVKIPDTADGGYAIVSNTAQPRLLSVFVPGSNGDDFSLAYFAAQVTLAAPPSAEVVDGSQYGF
jgi:hypothetical protein